MRFSELILCLFVVFHSCYGKSVENPAYGYHMKIGIPLAQSILRAETLRTSRIIGGSQVSGNTVIPYQAGIIATLTAGQTSVCGGSLISATRVLTAAHCWFDGKLQARQFLIVLGSLTIFTGGTRITTTDVTMHPSWNYFLNDIAMVKITSVTLSNSIAVIALPTTADASQNFAGSTGTVSGFGKLTDAQTTFAPTTALHQVSVPIITNAVCQNSFTVTLSASHLCTAGTGAKGTCEGDSGGPLTVVHKNKKILVGIVSFGPSEGCQKSLPSVFTRVTSFLPWINSQL